MISSRLFSIHAVAALLLGLSFSFSSFAEEPKKGEEPKKNTEKPVPEKSTTGEEKPEPKTDQQPVNDPTQPSAKLRQALKGPERPAEVIRVELPKPPEIVLKGIIRAANKPPAAVLEVKGHVAQVVREGSQITAPASDGTSVELLVKKVSSEGIEIEIPKLKQTLIVR